MVELPTFYVICYEQQMQFSIEELRRLVQRPRNFLELLESQDENIDVGVYYAGKVFPGKVVIACWTRQTASAVYEACVYMRAMKKKKLPFILKKFPRIVDPKKRLRIPTCCVSI